MNNIYYLGPKGSYSYSITEKVFGEHEFIACNNFQEIVKNTLAEKGALGVLPIENSITSNIHENMDYLFRENLTIISEAYLKIRLYLIGFKEATIKNIKKVYSHPQALSQCENFIRKHSFTAQETASTAAAKNLILKINDKRVALIGSKELVDDKSLKILSEDIGDEKFNITRFVFVSSVLARSPAERDDEVISINNGIAALPPLSGVARNDNKASIMFTVPHKAGTLAKILTEFSKVKFNLVKIDSRPIPGTQLEYQFWVDIESDKEIKQKNLFDILKNNSQAFKLIGIYPSGKIYE